MLNLKLIKKHIKHIILLLSINWIKTIYLNFKMLPFKQAVKFPIVIYGKITFRKLSGQIIIDSKIHFAMIGLGQKYEMIRKSKGNAELNIEGIIKFKGFAQFGIDYFISINKNSICEFGNMASLGGNGKLICTNKIVLGNFTRIGYESQVIDTNFHRMINLETNELSPISYEINLGDYNFIGGRTMIMPRTITPKYCTIAAFSLINKDYSKYGENILLGGIPCKLIKENIARECYKNNKDKLLQENLKVW